LHTRLAHETSDALQQEDSDAGVGEESVCLAEVERRKNELKISYQFGENTRQITLDRRLKIFDFKMKVE
jgi:hypothetical protein